VHAGVLRVAHHADARPAQRLTELNENVLSTVSPRRAGPGQPLRGQQALVRGEAGHLQGVEVDHRLQDGGHGQQKNRREENHLQRGAARVY
jgi:hypothetical protein